MWEKHLTEIQASEMLNGIYVQDMAWMDGDHRAEAIFELQRAAGIDPSKHDGVERVSEDDFRRDIGARPRANKEG